MFCWMRPVPTGRIGDKIKWQRKTWKSIKWKGDPRRLCRCPLYQWGEKIKKTGREDFSTSLSLSTKPNAILHSYLVLCLRLKYSYALVSHGITLYGCSLSVSCACSASCTYHINTSISQSVVLVLLFFSLLETSEDSYF